MKNLAVEMQQFVRKYGITKVTPFTMPRFMTQRYTFDFEGKHIPRNVGIRVPAYSTAAQRNQIISAIRAAIKEV
jgi:hypothetical protein